MKKIIAFLVLISFPFQVGAAIDKYECTINFSFLGCNQELLPGCAPNCGWSHLEALICNLVNFIANCLAQAALIFGIAFGGINIMMAAGDPSKIEFGKKTIIGSVIGFSIVVLAGEIISLFLNL